MLSHYRRLCFFWGRLRVPTRRCDLVVPADWGWGRSNEAELIFSLSCVLVCCRYIPRYLLIPYSTILPTLSTRFSLSTLHTYYRSTSASSAFRFLPSRHSASAACTDDGHLSMHLHSPLSQDLSQFKPASLDSIATVLPEALHIVF